ncbi:MAG: oligosaccharide flippase family protein [bacterium]|nr:oligosaccharide flippase family protein [bacterium]
MRNEAKHSLILIGGTGATAALGLAYSVYAGRMLGPSDYADFAAAVSLVMFFNIALGPINGTIARFTAQFRARGEPGRIRGLGRAVIRRVAFYGLIVAGGAMLLGSFVAEFLQWRAPLLIVAIAIVYVTVLLSVPRGVLRGVQSFGHLSINTLVEAALRLAGGVALLMFVGGVGAALTAYLLGALAVLLLGWLQLRSVWAGCPVLPVDGTAVKRFTLPLFVMMAVSAGYQNLDMLLVKRCFASEHAGAYGATFTLARTMSVLVTPFTILLLPLLTTLHEQRRRWAGSFLRVCGYFLLLSVGPLLLFYLFPGWIIERLYGPQFGGAAALLLPLAIARVVGFLGHLLALAGVAANRFGFLVVYVPGLAAEIVALALWHDSLAMVVTVVLTVQAVTVAGLCAVSIVQTNR